MIDLERPVNHDGFVLWRRPKEKHYGFAWRRCGGSKGMVTHGEDKTEVKEKHPLTGNAAYICQFAG